MGNKVGQVVFGSGFFEYPKGINKIEKSLENGNHVYLSAPKRVGETSIMNRLKSTGWEGWNFIYEITESAGGTEKFYEVLSKKLLKIEAISKVQQASDKFEKDVQKLINHIHISVKLPFVEIETQNTESISFTSEFEHLLEEVDLDGEKLVTLIDEFPKTIENIMARESTEEALRFYKFSGT